MILVEFYCFIILLWKNGILSHKLSPCTVMDAKIVDAEKYLNSSLIEKIILNVKARHQAPLN